MLQLLFQLFQLFHLQVLRVAPSRCLLLVGRLVRDLATGAPRFFSCLYFSAKGWDTMCFLLCACLLSFSRLQNSGVLWASR